MIKDEQKVKLTLPTLTSLSAKRPAPKEEIIMVALENTYYSMDKDKIVTYTGKSSFQKSHDYSSLASLFFQA